MFKRTTAVLVACAAIAYTGTLLNAQGPAVKRTVLLQHDTSVPGYEALLVAVEIPVGGREGRHMHPGTAMIHVTDGALTLDYEGKPAKAIATFIIPKGQPVTTQVGAATK